MKTARWKTGPILPFCVLTVAICVASCSMPNLDPPECAAARDVVKQFYALGIGGDPMSHPEILARWKSLRSPNYSAGPTRDDDSQFYFSAVEPTSSRVGECKLLDEGRVTVEATVIWRASETNYTRTDTVTLARVNDAWLVERIDVGEQPAISTK